MNPQTSSSNPVTGNLPPVGFVNVTKGTAQAVSAPDPRESAAANLQLELDSIANRPIEDTACREAMLACVLRNQAFAGGAWFRAEDGQVAADVSQMPANVADRKEVKRWLVSVSNQAITEHRSIVARSVIVQNLTAISVPVSVDRRSQPRTSIMSAEPLPPLTLTVLAKNVADRESFSEELLAAQCVVRAWRDWSRTTIVHHANERLLATSAILELVGKMVATETVREACQTLANTLQEHFKATFVAVALRPASRVTARLTCVSGVGDFDRSAPQSTKLEAALNETLVRSELTTYPVLNDRDRHQHLAHKRAVETCGVDAVVSIPLTDEDGQVVGSVMLGGAGRLLRMQTRNVIAACQTPVGNAIATVIRTEGGMVSRISRRFRRLAASQKGITALAILIALVAVMLMPAPYHIPCRCRIEPVVRRHCLAPYDGLLENTFVEPGDIVREGDRMARMQGRELRLELASVAAEYQQASKERDMHTSEMAVAKSLLSELEMEKLAAKEQLLSYRLDNLEIRSPVDGVVLDGSLDRRVNYPVSVGQAIYEIAPMESMRIEVAVPAEEINHVRVDMDVEVRMDGMAGSPIRGRILHIWPRSEVREEQNVFIAEVVVSNIDGQLRPGMEGAVRIVGDHHPIGWNLCHRAWERVITRVWW